MLPLEELTGTGVRGEDGIVTDCCRLAVSGAPSPSGSIGGRS